MNKSRRTRQSFPPLKDKAMPLNLPVSVPPHNSMQKGVLGGVPVLVEGSVYDGQTLADLLLSPRADVSAGLVEKDIDCADEVGVCVCDARDLGAVVVVDELLLRRRWRHGPHTRMFWARDLR